MVPPPTTYMILQGIVLVTELMDCYGLDVVQAYMKHIQVTLLGTYHNHLSLLCLSAPICLSVYLFACLSVCLRLMLK